MSMKWKINDIRISSCSDLNYIRMVCKKICTIPILYLYSNNLVFDVGVQLQDICFPRPYSSYSYHLAVDEDNQVN